MYKANFTFSLLIVLVLVSCGTKPQPNLEPIKSPEHLWQLFSAKYDSVQSLALKGSFEIRGDKAFETSLQTVYSSPDSFAFLAEATLGIDAARGALINGVGFWEVPREKYSQDITLFDMITIDSHSLEIDILLQAMFFFKGLEMYEFKERNGYRYSYVRETIDQINVLEINGDTGTPIKLTVLKANPYSAGVYEINYFNWQKTKNQLIYPGRIMLNSSSGKLEAEYNIRRIKLNPKLPASLFIPRL